MEQANPEVEKPSLEQLAREFEVNEMPPRQSVPQAAPPMPEDLEERTKWLAERYEETNRYARSVEEKLVNRDMEDARTQAFKTVETAVDEIGADLDVSKRFIKGMIHEKYAADDNFRKIFDNRDKNPQAFKKALAIIKDEVIQEAQIKYDPQVAEDQKALNQLQRNARSGKTAEDPNEKWKNMTASQFDHEWQKLLGY